MRVSNLRKAIGRCWVRQVTFRGGEKSLPRTSAARPAALSAETGTRYAPAMASPYGSPHEHPRMFLPYHRLFQRRKLRLKRWGDTCKSHSYQWAETALCRRQGGCSPRKQLVQDLLCSGEGRVEDREGGDAGDVPTREGLQRGLL